MDRGVEVLTRQKYGAYVDGVDVCLVLGDRACRLEYAVALNLAAILYDAGRQAKAAAGDHSLRITALARLTDANLDEMQAQRSRDCTAVYAKC